MNDHILKFAPFNLYLEKLNFIVDLYVLKKNQNDFQYNIGKKCFIIIEQDAAVKSTCMDEVTKFSVKYPLNLCKNIVKPYLK